MAETWSLLTTAEVLQEFTPAEKAALEAIQGVSTNLATIVTRTMDQVRNAYLSGGRSVEDVGIPDGEKERAIAVARWRWLISLPQAKSMQTEERKAAFEAGRDWFNDIAMRKIVGSGSAQIVSAPERRATRAKTDGLF